jgi:hypothetical protein
MTIIPFIPGALKFLDRWESAEKKKCFEKVTAK